MTNSLKNFEDFVNENLNEGRKPGEHKNDWSIFKITFSPSGETHYGKKKGMYEPNTYGIWIKSNAKTTTNNPQGNTALYKMMRSHKPEDIKIERVFNSGSEDEVIDKMRNLIKNDNDSINSIGSVVKKAPNSKASKIVVPKDELMLNLPPSEKNLYISSSFAGTKENGMLNRIDTGKFIYDKNRKKFVRIKNRKNVVVIDLKGEPISAKISKPADRELDITEGTTVGDVIKFFKGE